MAERPKIEIQVYVAGADGTVNDLEKVAEAQGDVADAAGKAGAAAEKAAKQAEAGKSRWGKLVDGLKAGAGAAASSSAALAGVASTLAVDLDDATKVSVAALQGLSGVLGAFGPLGQLAATGVSLAAAALATFGAEAEKYTPPTGDFAEELKALGENASFMAKAMGPAVAELHRYRETLKLLSEGDAAAVSMFGVPIEEVPTRWVDAGNAVSQGVERATKALVESRKALVALQAEHATKGLDLAYFRREQATLEAAAEKARFDLKNAVDARNQVAKAFKNSIAPLGPELDTRTPRKAGPRKPVEFPAIQAAIRSTGFMLDNLLASFDRELGIAQDAVARQAAFEADYYASQEAAAAAHAQYMSEQAAAPWEVMVREAEASRSAIDAMTAKVQDFGVAAGESFAAAAVASAIYGGSLMDAANQQLQAATVTAVTEAAIATAKGFGYLGAGLFGYGPGFAAAEASFTSAAVWGGVGLATGLGAAATGGFGSGGAGGGPGLGGLGGGYAPDPFKPPQGFGARPYEDDRQTEITVNLSGGQGAPSRQQATAIIGALIDLARGAQIDLGGPFGPRGRR